MNSYSDKMIKSQDIYFLMKALSKIGWKAIKETSINRIMYLSAVLYSFRYTDEQNIFSKNYQFAISIGGPEDAGIDNALVNLESNDVIISTSEGYEISNNDIISIAMEQDLKKKQWFDDIAYIVGVYGEDKIYDFIFRDPQYRESLGGNSIYNLNIDIDNATVNFLNEFKRAFEEKLERKEDALDSRKYLELYFEYVFGMIIRGEK